MGDAENPRREFLGMKSNRMAVRQHRRLTPGQQLKQAAPAGQGSDFDSVEPHGQAKLLSAAGKAVFVRHCSTAQPRLQPFAPVTRFPFHVHYRDDPYAVRLRQINDRIRKLAG